ncbi:MAG TPA: contractile injection system tape measure protein [Chitinophagaceae bacterium]|jgi:hypothetical protein|nr:contractile injection system tape measure protein [Chitinophagaceae bacterium]
MPANDHIINRQVFEFECLHSEHAFQIKNKFDQDVQYKISKIIERACEKLAIEDEDIRISLLEVDLGKIAFHRMEEDILWAFEKKFNEKLFEQKTFSVGKHFPLFAKTKSSFEIATFFLLTGQLPWFTGKKDGNYLVDIFDEVITTSGDSLRRFILSNLDNDKLIERLTTQYDVLLMDKLIGLLEPGEELFIYMEATIRKIAGEIISLMRPADYKSKQESYDVLYPEDRSVTSGYAVKLLAGQINDDPDFHSIYLRKFTLEIILKLIAVKNNISTVERFYELLKKILAEKLEISQTILHSVALKEWKEDKDLALVVEQAKYKQEEIKAIAAQQPHPVDKNDSLKFYISNAGLILIANYLPAFLNEVRLLDNGNFIYKSHQIKAVFLLHYLCTGKEEAAEYILPLNKILCGLALDEPLPSNILLDQNEKRECWDLLHEIITNWQKIGNLTIEGFQESFLNRDGILMNEFAGWKLKVQRKGFDVLLDSIPWSFNHIKLTWMQDLIITEW